MLPYSTTSGPWYQERRRQLISDTDDLARHFIESSYPAQTTMSRVQSNISLLSYYIQQGYCKDNERAYKTIRNLQRQVGSGGI